MAGRDLPLAPTLGFITRVSGVPDGLIGRVMHAPRLHMRPDGGGLIALHHHEADAGITAGEKPADWARELVERFISYVPEAQDARVSRWTVATRPIPADGRTSAGLLPSIPGYGEIVTHSAITMGALLPKIVAQEIVTGEVDPLLGELSARAIRLGDRLHRTLWNATRLLFTVALHIALLLGMDEAGR